jgi:hypothetical protein
MDKINRGDKGKESFGEELEQAHKVAWEYVSPRLPSRFIQKLAASPAFFRGGSDSDNVSRLEVELLLDRCGIIV